MSKINSYRDLMVWQKSIDLVEQIYLTTGTLPKAEMYGLVSQMQRAAVSIPSNIAEGQSRNHLKEYVQFLSIALGSTGELITQIIICQRIKYIDETVAKNLTERIEEIRKMLTSLKQKLQPVT